VLPQTVEKRVVEARLLPFVPLLLPNHAKNLHRGQKTDKMLVSIRRGVRRGAEED